MKRLVFLCSLFLFWAPLASAEPMKGFAYVNVERAFSKSNAFKQLQDRLEKQINAKKKELEGMQKRIETMRNDLEKRGNLMKADARSKLSEEISTEFRKFQRAKEDSQAALQKDSQREKQKILRALQEVIREIGKEQGYSLILDQALVVYADEKTNITDTVIQRLNVRTKDNF